MKSPTFMIVNPKAKGGEPFAFGREDTIVDCLIRNFVPADHEAVLRQVIFCLDPALKDQCVAKIMAKVSERELKCVESSASGPERSENPGMNMTDAASDKSNDAIKGFAT